MSQRFSVIPVKLSKEHPQWPETEGFKIFDHAIHRELYAFYLTESIANKMVDDLNKFRSQNPLYI